MSVGQDMRGASTRILLEVDWQDAEQDSIEIREARLGCRLWQYLLQNCSQRRTSGTREEPGTLTCESL